LTVLANPADSRNAWALNAGVAFPPPREGFLDFTGRAWHMARLGICTLLNSYGACSLVNKQLMARRGHGGRQSRTSVTSLEQLSNRRNQDRPGAGFPEHRIAACVEHGLGPGRRLARHHHHRDPPGRGVGPKAPAE